MFLSYHVFARGIKVLTVHRVGLSRITLDVRPGPMAYRMSNHIMSYVPTYPGLLPGLLPFFVQLREGYTLAIFPYQGDYQWR